MEKIIELYPRILRLYKRYGIKSVTMDDIARELGISKKTLYETVKDKEDLVRKVMEYDYQTINNCVSEMYSHPGMNAIEQLIEVSFFMRDQLKEFSSSLDYDLKKYYPVLFEELTLRKQEEMYASVLQNMEKGKKEGIYREDLREDIIAKLFVTRILSVPRSSIISIEDFIAPESYREYYVYHIRGISNEKGIKILEQNIHKLDHSDNEKNHHD